MEEYEVGIVSEEVAETMFHALKGHDWFRAMLQVATKAVEFNTVDTECVTVSIKMDESCDDREDELTWSRVVAYAEVYTDAGKIDVMDVKRTQVRSE